MAQIHAVKRQPAAWFMVGPDGKAIPIDPSAAAKILGGRGKVLPISAAKALSGGK